MDPEVISALISTSSGDLRRAITYLQSASRLSSSTIPPTTITVSDIQEIAGVVPTADINNFARSLGVESELDMDVDTDANKTSRFELIKRQVKLLMRNGYSASQILSQVRMKWH
jgi:replication factor C subunit 2/4